MLKLLRNNRLLVSNVKSYNNYYLFNRNLSVLLNNVNLESNIPSTLSLIDNNIDYKLLLPKICALGKQKLYKDISHLIINIPIEQLINESVNEILIKAPDSYKNNVSEINGLVENKKKYGSSKKYIKEISEKNVIDESLRSEFALIHILESFTATKNIKIFDILDYSYTNISVSNIIGCRRLVRICKQFNSNDVNNNNNNNNNIINEKNIEKLLIKQYIKWLIDMSTTEVMVSLKQLIRTLKDIKRINPIIFIENLMKEIDYMLKNDTKFISKSILGDVAMITFSNLRQIGKTVQALTFLKKAKDNGYLSPYYLDVVPFTLAVVGCLSNQQINKPSFKIDSENDIKILLNELFNCVSGATERDIFLREQFFQVLISQKKNKLVLEFGEILKSKELLYGSRIYNLIASIQAKELNSRKFWENTIDEMKKEAALVALNPHPNREKIGLIDYPPVEFGPNVHTYISIVSSISDQKIPINEVIENVNILLNRIISDGVIPDMRFLFNIAELGREGLDFPFTMKAVELAHFSGNVPRRNLNPYDTSWQPPTVLPSQLESNSNIDTNHQTLLSNRIISMAENKNVNYKIPSNDKKLIIHSHDEMTQIYHYAIDTAKLCKRPDDVILLLNIMINMRLIPASHTTSRAMRCLLDHHRPKEVIRLFELMPFNGIERDKRHATLFVEALIQLNRYSDAWRGLLHMNGSGSSLMISAYRKLLSQLLTSLSKKIRHIDQSKSKFNRQELLEVSVKTFCHIVEKLQTDDKVKTINSVEPSLAVIRKFIDTANDDLIKKFFNIVDAIEGNIEAIEILNSVKPKHIQSRNNPRNTINEIESDDDDDDNNNNNNKEDR